VALIQGQDREALLNGTLSLVHARGILPDGLVFQMPEADPLPPARNISELFSPVREHVTVYLAIPPRIPDGLNCALEGDGENTSARYLAESGLSALPATLGRLFAVAEAYPDLKANTTMMTLMEELTSTENKVAFARQAYNDSVMAYNTLRETFPTNMIAGPFNFGPAELFVIEKPEEKEAPKVSFS